MRRRWIFTLSMILSACGGQGARGADDPSEAASPEPETERERLARTATEKREQCQTLGDAIEKSESGGTEFVNLNDETKLKALADERTATAERIDALNVTAEDLAPVAADYVTLNRDMVEALNAIPASSSDAIKKQKLDSYRKLEQDVEAIIERFNQTCDGR